MKTRLANAEARVKQLQEEAMFNEQSRLLTLSAIVRRYGTDDGRGGKSINIPEADLLNVPPDSNISIAPGTKESPGITISVTIEPQPVAEAESNVTTAEPATTSPQPDDPKEAPSA